MLKKIREDWKIVKLGEFAAHEKGKKPKNQKTEMDDVFKHPYVNIAAFEKGIVETFTDGEKCNFCYEDDFLMVWDGSRSGLVGKGIQGALGSTLVRINFPGIKNNYAYHYLSSKYQEINTRAKGSGTPHVDPYLLWNYDFPIAPLPEQRAIVARIEELFSDLDKGIADLKKAQDQLKVYRQAVLKKAFEGKSNKTKQIKEVVEKVQIGPFGSQLHKSDYVIDKIPLINPMHIKNGEIRPNITYTITPQKRDSLPNYILKVGDVIMGRRGEMGRSALVTKNEIGWFCGTGSLYLRPNLLLLAPSYLNKYIQSSVVKELLTGSAIGTTMMNLNKKIINNLPIPVPSLLEQHQIIQEIESRLSVCDNVEQSISESLEKAKALRQSILKKAFEGTLLSATEIAKCKAAKDYEPASVLLEKIKKEKKK
jgi:type I restriction enzyme S subunit